MPAYEATPAELEQYGASLNIWDQIRLLSAWSPLIGFGQRFVAEPDAYKRSLIVAEACEWLASKTDSRIDDELVNVLAALLQTPQGEAFVRWALSKAALVK